MIGQIFESARESGEEDNQTAILYVNQEKGKKQKGKRSKVSQNRYQTVEKKGRYLLLYRTS